MHFFSVILLFGCLGWGSALQASELLVGTTVHFYEYRNDSTQYAKFAQEAGMNTFRGEVYWNAIETKKGELRFPESLTAIDTAINTAVAAKNQPLLLLDYGDPYYDNGSFPITEEAQAGFVRYVEFIVSRYKGKVKHYEIWNEWNLGMGSGRPLPYPGKAKDYVALLKKAYVAIKRIDPSAVVIAGAIAERDIPWLKEMLAQAGGYYDGVSVHPYNFSAGPAGRTPEEAITWLRSLKDTIASYTPGKTIPIFVTEIGWPTHLGWNGISQESAASYLARFFLLCKLLPEIQGIWWYDFRDDGLDATNQEHNFGLLLRNYEPKPAYYALRDVAPLVREALSVEQLQTQSNLFALKFLLPNGGGALALWSTDPGKPFQVTPASPASGRELKILEVGHSEASPTSLKDKPSEPYLVGERPWLWYGDPQDLRIEKSVQAAED